MAVGKTTFGTTPARSSSVSGARIGMSVRAVTREGSSGSSNIAPAAYSTFCVVGSNPTGMCPVTP
jgi:hypothetical protein